MTSQAFSMMGSKVPLIFHSGCRRPQNFFGVFTRGKIQNFFQFCESDEPSQREGIACVSSEVPCCQLPSPPPSLSPSSHLPLPASTHTHHPSPHSPLLLLPSPFRLSFKPHPPPLSPPPTPAQVVAVSALEARRKEEEKEEQEKLARSIEEKEQLLAVPRALRTPEQRRRIDELVAESLASRYPQLARRKKKKRRKKRLPRSPRPRPRPRCPASWSVWIRRTLCRVSMAALVVDSGICMCGRCARVSQRQCYGQTVQNSVLVPQLSFIGVASFVPQRQIPMVQTVQLTTEIPQMPFVFRWSMPLLCIFCASQVLSVHSALLGSTADTCGASVYGVFIFSTCIG